MRVAAASAAGLELRSVTLDEGLAACRLVVDATPSADLVDASWVTGESIAAVPGMPSAFTTAAQTALGDHHIQEPLALGVAVMAVQILA